MLDFSTGLMREMLQVSRCQLHLNVVIPVTRHESDCMVTQVLQRFDLASLTTVSTSMATGGPTE